ncbi:MAG: ATP-dependent DNA helicase RecG [Planctomycetales bacterium]|nr:ATP-dependent DNA helicase RecG [Planctomycetales bacterium]
MSVPSEFADSADSPDSANGPVEPQLTELLGRPVQFLKGVGPQRAKALERRGLRTALDLLFFFPRDYQQVAPVAEIAELRQGVEASVIGVVEEAELREFASGKSSFGALIRQDASCLRAVWFNQAYMASQVKRGDRLMLTGVPKRRTLTWEMTHPRVTRLEEEQEPPGAELLPIYSLTEGVRQSVMRKVVHRVVDDLADKLDEVFPDEYLEEHGLLGVSAALRAVHMPESREQLSAGRRRLVYQELLVLQLAIAIRRWRRERMREAPALESTAKIDARIRRLFPFELTEDQRCAIEDVRRDMALDIPMNRLLQGDVGTGKTMVAIYALLLAVAHQKQAALMAPTEVLARQHARTLERSLAESRVRIGLLTGSLTPARRRKLLEEIRDGQIDLVIGTHAIANAVAQQEFEFKNLALVIVDEQHKFGVRQRAALKLTSREPHCLVMSATPIPRTMSMTLFGDMDVTTLRNAPPGRQNVHTYWVEESMRERWWAFFARKLREGRQGYVVAPVVDEDEENAVTSAEECFELLANGPLEAFRLDLLHGRMSPNEKDAAMQRFERGETQVLVCTTVVEVGIDVPNATLMTVEGGERFGLAQLHQLRGRIRRGKHPGFVAVFGDPQTDDGRKRLEAFCRTSDGFELAELDFRLRGPGDLFGTKQHGLPPLRIADLQRDTELLALAQQDARSLLEDDPGFEAPRHRRLREMVLRRYGETLDLSDV